MKIINQPVVFLAEFPDKNTIKEGMSQRMAAVDMRFKDDPRLYLYVSHRFFRTKEVSFIEDNVVQYKCNLFIHFFFIIKVLSKSSFIYFHSIQNVLPVLPCLWFLTAEKKMVLDIHGVVPEEHEFAGNKIKSLFYSIAERYLFKYLKVGISVTESMSDYYRNKYPDSNAILINFPIIPSNIMNDKFSIIDDSERQKINVIYSGNLQSWQNIDLMVGVIKKNISSEIIYTILTGDPEQMKSVLTKNGLTQKDNVFVDSVAPEELKRYYEKAHYGFILRDDITVNRVACPTKMIEYLFYGLTPIIKSNDIGDFLAMGYEYLSVDSFEIRNLIARKSKKNTWIVSQIKNKCKDTNIRELLLANLSNN